jgi:hypothetical protein
VPEAFSARSGGGHWAKLAQGVLGLGSRHCPKLDKVPVITAGSGLSGKQPLHRTDDLKSGLHGLATIRVRKFRYRMLGQFHASPNLIS